MAEWGIIDGALIDCETELIVYTWNATIAGPMDS